MTRQRQAFSCKCLHSLLISFALYPLADIGRATEQADTALFAGTQETYDLRIHNRDFAQVNNCPFRAVAYFLLHQLQITRANSADQPDDFALPVGLPFNFQEMSTPP